MRKISVFMSLVLATTVMAAGHAAAYEAVPVPDGGTLSGTVKFDGPPPPPAKIEVSKDNEVCGKEKMAPDLVIGAGGGIANAVVMVKAAKGTAPIPPAQNPVLDQKTCEYKPHILVFPAGSTVDVMNSDGILHNIHTFGTTNTPMNQAQPKFKPKIQIKVEKAEWPPIPVKCDVHGWMSAYFVATEHPYVAVTDTSGNFTITDLPPGDYEVEVWQEKLGKTTQKVSIKAKETTKVDWALKKS